LCLILGLFLFSPKECFGQSPPGSPRAGSQFAAANPTNREEKKDSLASKDIKPPESGQKTSVVVRHLDVKQDGLKVAETAHFRILHDQERVVVNKVGEAAELARIAAQRKWFGAEAADWDGKCSIYLHPDREKYSAKTKMKNTLGHMRTLDFGGMLYRSIHLPCKEPNLFSDVLPHEVSHSVMAIRLQGRTPRWADEGMAMLAESPESIDECVDRLPRYRKKDGLFALEILMQTDEPDHYGTMEYYSQATSLVQFLVSQKGPPTFINFLRTYISKGPEPALKQHYAIQNFADLEKRWQAFAFGKKKG
jgi:hypothetical protein